MSYREQLKNPWDDVAVNYPQGAVVQGTVTRTAVFGAFVKLGPGIEGLIHISELAHQRISKAEQVVSQGQELEVKVLSVDPEAQRISLSLKAIQAVTEPAGGLESAEASEPPKSVVPEHTGPLKGGVENRSEGEKFGLKW